MHISTIASTAVIAGLAAAAPSASCKRSTKAGITHVECTYRIKKVYGNDAQGHSPPMPQNYTNMQFEIYGASGGAALDSKNRADAGSRGNGAYVKFNVKDGLDEREMYINPGANGKDATTSQSGERAPGSDWAYGGRGGICRGAFNARHAGSGGSPSGITIINRSVYHVSSVIVGGGGGAGGTIGNATSRGGDAGLLYPNQPALYGAHGAPKAPYVTVVADGTPGLPDNRGGPAGGSNRIDQAKAAAIEYKVRDGQGGEGFAVCLAAGGAGGGFNSGMGGLSYTHPAVSPDLNEAAGGGGGGASFVDARLNEEKTVGDAFTVIESKHIYTEDPRIVWAYDVPSDSLCVIC